MALLTIADACRTAQNDRDQPGGKMRIRLLSLLVLLAAPSVSFASSPDCVSVRAWVNQKVHALMKHPQELDDTVEADALSDGVHHLARQERACLGKTEIDSLLQLYAHPDSYLRLHVSDALKELAPVSLIALPALHEQFEIAQRREREYVRELEREGKIGVISGFTESGALDSAISVLGSWKASPPQWRSGTCARMEEWRDGLIHDVHIFVIEGSVAEAECTAGRFETDNSWEYESEENQEPSEIPADAFLVQSRLDQALKGVRAWDVCLPAERAGLSASLRLDEMAPVYVYHSRDGFDSLMFGSRSSIGPNGYEWVAFIAPLEPKFRPQLIRDRYCHRYDSDGK